jgi:hypothetical protein
VFTPETLAKLRSGELTLMGSASRSDPCSVVVDSANKKTTEIGRIRTRTKTVYAERVWSILALVTSQHYLADIQKRLVAIQDSVQKLRYFLETSEWGRLRHCQCYLDEVCHYFSEECLSPLERAATVGRSVADNRRFVHGVLWVMRSGMR